MKKPLLSGALLALSLGTGYAQSALKPVINQASDAIESKVIAWRRDFHEHPELGNQEFRTAKIVAEHLRKLGYEVKEKVAVTGVIGVLK
ncbi:MAG TPA: amidohydrolase, partial [Runella sp.]|nr:amidohydrolase [Runella sp.]